MRKEPATRLLHLARQFAADPAGITLDEIASRFSVSRRTAERMRDTIAEVFPQLEEIEGERPKRLAAAKRPERDIPRTTRRRACGITWHCTTACARRSQRKRGAA